jgi:hypothetical protein
MAPTRASAENGANSHQIARSSTSAPTRRTARSRSFFVALTARRATARSTKSEPNRTSDQRRARASPGRRPAYANVETSTASRRRPAVSSSTRILSTPYGARAATNRSRRGFGFRTSRTGFTSINPRSTANRQAPETIASAFATVAAPTSASSRDCLNASTRPGVSERIVTSPSDGRMCRVQTIRYPSRVFSSQRHDMRLPPAFNHFGERLRAPQRVERHAKLSQSLLLTVPLLSVPPIRERLRTVTAVGTPPHDELARSLVRPDAHAARSMARSLSDEPTGTPASGSEWPGDGVGRRPASIHARKSSGQTTHRLRTFDPTSSPA